MWISIVLGLVVAIALAYAGRSWWAWSAGWILPLAQWWSRGGSWGLAIVAVVWLAVAIATGVPAIRRRVLTGPAMRALASRFPRLGDTERVALEAGTTWWDAELFSGAPRWERITQFAPQPLSQRERDFLDGPCTQLCPCSTTTPSGRPEISRPRCGASSSASGSWG